MSANGRRRWRKWLRKQRKKRNYGVVKLRRDPGLSALNPWTNEARRHAQPGLLPPLPAKAFDSRSLVGQTMSARKRRARIECMAGELLAEQPRKVWLLWWDGRAKHYADLGEPDGYREARAKYRIGERLRPCIGCPFCEEVGWTRDEEPMVPLWRLRFKNRHGVFNFEYPDTEDGDPSMPHCDGSGAIVTRMRCPGDRHFSLVERRWIYVADCRLCAGKGTVKLPLKRTGPKCPGCCNCAVNVCQKRDPDGYCTEDYMHCEDGVLPSKRAACA